MIVLILWVASSRRKYKSMTIHSQTTERGLKESSNFLNGVESLGMDAEELKTL